MLAGDVAKFGFVEASMKKKASLLLSVVLYGLCAVIWSIKAVYVVISTPSPTTSFLLASDIPCAIIWIAAFIVQIIRYKNFNKEG